MMIRKFQKINLYSRSCGPNDRWCFVAKERFSAGHAWVTAAGLSPTQQDSVARKARSMKD